MADDLKRVGLIFDAQGAVDFKASLKSVNTALNDNRAQFKLTKSTWDENTKASEKLRATNEYLAKQYEDSAKKVSVLKAEIKELESAEKKDEAAISKKKSALASAQTAMNNYKKGLEETSAKLKAGTADIEEYAKKLQATGDKAKKAGSALTKGVTAPIIATGTAATTAWVKIDEAYDNIVAGTGATGESLTALQDVFDEVYGSMPVSAEDASTAVADLNTRFGLTGDALEEATKKFLKYSTVNKTDVSTSIANVAKAMSDAKIPTKDLGQVLDKLTVASQASGVPVDQLADALSKNGVNMRQLGYDTDDTIAMLATFEQKGVDSSVVLTGMKGAVKNYAKEGKDAKAELQNLFLAIENGSATAADAQEAFGSKAGAAIYNYAREGKLNFTDMLKVIGEANGGLETSFDTMLSPADNAKVALNNLTLAGASLGEVIQEALGPIFEKLATILQSVTKWFKGLDDTTKTIVVAIGGVVAAIGPLLVIFGTLAGSISKIITLYASFKTATVGAEGSTTLLSGAMSALSAPVIAIIAVIGAVVAALVQLWNTNEEFRTAVQGAIESIQGILSNLWETIIQPIFTSIKDVLVNVWENGIQPLWDTWVNFVGDIAIQMMGLFESIEPILNWFIDTFGPMLTGVFDFVAQTFGNNVTNILEVAGALLENIGDIISSIIGVLKGIIDFVVNIFTGNWQGAWDSIVSIFGNIFDGLIAIAKAPINIVIGFINGMISGVESGVNACIKMLNHLSFDVPDWIPGIGGDHWGFDLDPVNFGRIPYLAKGGQLLNGMAMIAEAGPELLFQQGNRTTVAPLTNGGGATPVDIIDYDRMTAAFIKALRHLKLSVNEDVFAELVDERILKAV